MTRIKLQVQICERLAESPLTVNDFFALCFIADLVAEKQVVTRASLVGKTPFDVYNVFRRLLAKGMLKEIPIRCSIEGVHGAATCQYVLTQHAIKMLADILN